MEILFAEPRAIFSFLALRSDVELGEIDDLLDPIRGTKKQKVKTYDRDGGVQALFAIDRWLQANKIVLPTTIKVEDCRLYEVSVPITEASTIQHLVAGRRSTVLVV